ncbi:MAG TPA: Ig domain-containing protein, partial [bacterium]|nr:Ig domain-containing protein [bacterium]
TDNCCEGTRSDVQTFTLTLDDDCGAAPEITSTPNVLPNAQVGVEYSYTFTATADPDLTLTWEMTAGNLPAGLTFDAATATLSGTPTDNAESCQDWPITVTVTDDCCNGARSDFGDFSFTLDPLPCDPLGAISPLTLPNAVQGVPYEAILTVEGGFAPFTWAIIDGTLPAGLELDADLGIISGTPTESGCLDFIVQVTDSCRCEAQSTSRPYTNFCVEIGCPPEVRQLTAGQTVDAGDVTISNDGTNLYVTYDLHDGQGGLVEAQVYVGFTPPPSCGPGTFPYNSGALDCLDAYTFVIPLADHGFDACAGQSIYIATHATVEPCGDPNVQGNTAWTLCADDPNGIECETGWGMACPYEFCCPGGA